jgi:predicted 3-demethylubiquinone-9 3-methyltransferase (glyoxalase superfamily)
MAEDQAISPLLMFTGQAEEALTFYASLFEDASIESIQRYGPDDEGPTGQVVHARFRLKGQLFMASDSHLRHDFGFTPGISFFVACEDEAEIERLSAGLSEGGEFLMPLGAYPFARRYAWVQDRFGITWQLMLA